VPPPHEGLSADDGPGREIGLRLEDREELAAARSTTQGVGEIAAVGKRRHRAIRRPSGIRVNRADKVASHARFRYRAPKFKPPPEIAAATVETYF